MFFICVLAKHPVNKIQKHSQRIFKHSVFRRKALSGRCTCASTECWMRLPGRLPSQTPNRIPARPSRGEWWILRRADICRLTRRAPTRKPQICQSPAVINARPPRCNTRLCLPPPGQALSDGQWHAVSISVGGLQVSLSVDDEAASTMQLKESAQPGKNVLIGGGWWFHN